MLEGLITWVKDVIDSAGYPGLFLIVALENVFPLIPSEVVLPFAGFLAGEGRFNFTLVLLVSTAAAVVGSSLPYVLGRWLGEDRMRQLIVDKGRYVMLSAHHLERADDWFARYGGVTVFFARMVPGVRALISIPAGFARQPYWHFVIYTALGNALWNVLLIGAGYWLGNNWEDVAHILEPVSYVMYGLMAIGVLVLGYWLVQRRKQARAS